MHSWPWFLALGPVMSNNGGMSRGCTGGERETLCGCHHGSSALSLSCRQTDRKHHYAAWQSCLSRVVVTPPLGGILMSSPRTSIGHLTSWGEQGHPNTHIPPLSKTLSGHTLYTNATGSKVCMVGIVLNVGVYKYKLPCQIKLTWLCKTIFFICFFIHIKKKYIYIYCIYICNYKLINFHHIILHYNPKSGNVGTFVLFE